MYHIYRSGSGASTPSCSHPHYGTTSKPYDPYGRYQDHYGSNRSNNVRILKFGDTITEKSLENDSDTTISALKPTIIQVKGINKQKVSSKAAEIYNLRPPEPYKGKGIAYEGEFIRRKAGKTGK